MKKMIFVVCLLVMLGVLGLLSVATAGPVRGNIPTTNKTVVYNVDLTNANTIYTVTLTQAAFATDITCSGGDVYWPVNALTTEAYWPIWETTTWSDVQLNLVLNIGETLNFWSPTAGTVVYIKQLIN